MTCAYNEIYLENARRTMGEMYDYAVNVLKIKLPEFHRMFLISGMCRQFEIGNPTYVAGKNGCEVAKEVAYICTGESFGNDDVIKDNESYEKWVGSTLALYQWKSGRSFKTINNAYPIEKFEKLFAKNREDLDKVVEAIEKKCIAPKKEFNLKKLRSQAKLSQRELANAAGVPLRQIQLFEQGQRDINKTQGNTLRALAIVLHCDIADLLEEE